MGRSHEPPPHQAACLFYDNNYFNDRYQANSVVTNVIVSKRTESGAHIDFFLGTGRNMEASATVRLSSQGMIDQFHYQFGELEYRVSVLLL